VLLALASLLFVYEDLNASAGGAMREDSAKPSASDGCAVVAAMQGVRSTSRRGKSLHLRQQKSKCHKTLALLLLLTKTARCDIFNISSFSQTVATYRRGRAWIFRKDSKR